jgi:hypothetical protein
MLRTETVEPGALSLLKRLMLMPALEGFSLVGGTALSLRFGHRKSVDLDLFTSGAFDQQEVVDALTKEFGSSFVMTPSRAKWAIFGFINDVKVDLVNDPQERIAEVLVVDGIRMYADDDIAAMKVQAILNRGVKKDFWDLHELLQHHPLEWIMEKHKRKFPNQLLAVSIPKALIWFDDADNSEDPVALNGLTWADVKRSIRRTVNSFLL